MTISKQFLLLVVAANACSMYGRPPSNRHDSSGGDILLAAGVALAVAAGCYGAYKLGENISYNNARRNVNKMDSSLSALEREYLYALDKERAVRDYKENTAGFESLQNAVARDRRDTADWYNQSRDIISSWGSTDYAQDLVDDARVIEDRSSRAWNGLSAYEQDLHHIEPIVYLENMLAHERETKFYGTVNARNSVDFESKLRNAYAGSSWPFLQAHGDINARKGRYEAHVEAYNKNYHHQFAHTIQSASNRLAAYDQTQERIVANPSYTEDKREKIKDEREQEHLRLQRQRVEAEQRQARAAERQADAARQQAYAQQQTANALKQQNMHYLEARLYELRRQLDHATYYERDRIRAEISNVRAELCDWPLGLQLFVTIIGSY